MSWGLNVNFELVSELSLCKALCDAVKLVHLENIFMQVKFLLFSKSENSPGNLVK